jgi:hypothetical protein
LHKHLVAEAQAPRSPLPLHAVTAGDGDWAPIHRQLSEGGSSGCHACLLELLARTACAWPFSPMASCFLHAASGLLEAGVAAAAAQPPSQQGRQGSGEAMAALHAVGKALTSVVAGWCLAAGVGPPVVMPRAVRVAAAVAAARRAHAETPCLGCGSCLGSLGSLVLAATRLEAAAMQAGGREASMAQLARLLPLLSPLVARALGRQAGLAGGAEASGAELGLVIVSVRLMTVMLQPVHVAQQPGSGSDASGLGAPAATVGLLASCGALDALAVALGAAGRLAHDGAGGGGGGDAGSGGGDGGGGSGPGLAGAAACIFHAKQPASATAAAQPRGRAGDWCVKSTLLACCALIHTLQAIGLAKSGKEIIALKQAVAALEAGQAARAQAAAAAGQAGQAAAEEVGGQAAAAAGQAVAEAAAAAAAAAAGQTAAGQTAAETLKQAETQFRALELAVAVAGQAAEPAGGQVAAAARQVAAEAAAEAAAAGQAAAGQAATARDLGAALALLVVRSGALEALVGAAYAPPGDAPQSRVDASHTQVGGGGWGACRHCVR